MLSDEALHGTSHSPVSRSEGTQARGLKPADLSHDHPGCLKLGGPTVKNLSWMVQEARSQEHCPQRLFTF